MKTKQVDIKYSWRFPARVTEMTYFISEWVSISLTILTWSCDIEGHVLTFTLSYHITMAKAPELFFIECVLNLQNFLCF